MPSNRLALRAATTLAVTALTLGGLAVTSSPAQAIAAPGGLKADIRNSSTAILSWGGVTKATSYEVQVDTTSSFTSPDFTAKTTNTKSVSTKALVPGTNFFRVRSVVGSDRSNWAGGSFTVAPVTTPIPLAPANGALLPQPASPPLLQWSSSQGAVSYNVQVDGDSDFIGGKTYSTKTTSLVVPDPLTTGDWYWRVTAVKGPGLTSLASDTVRFDIDSLDKPERSFPPDSLDYPVTDIVLDWKPRAGARTYDLQVALDQSFNNIALNIKGIESTRYSPATTLNSDQFWWRVRGVDLAGQPTPWSESVNNFLRQWQESPSPVYPTGNVNSPTVYTSSKQYYQWTPAKHATLYILQIANDKNFSVGVDTCKTALTTYTPRKSSDCGFRSGTFYWKVIPIDAPYPEGDGLPGIVSPTQGITWSDSSTAPGLTWNDDPAANLEAAVGGNGIMSGVVETPNAGAGCELQLCEGAPTTPVLSWDPVPGAHSYEIYVAQDINFTTTELPDIPTTQNTMLALNLSDNKSSLPDSQVGKAYFWYVRPCTGSNGFDNVHPCGDTPAFRATPFTGTSSFSKTSPAIQDLQVTPSDGRSNDIQFDWRDYYDTNISTSWYGQPSTQTAKKYRIQVDNEPSFATPIDTEDVDQTTYTAWDKLYPDGTYFWRVQALDEENQGQAWSTVVQPTQANPCPPPSCFTKTTTPVIPSSPVGGVAVPGTTPFRWAAEPFTSSYTIEVYKNNDQSYSTANRVFTATVKTTAYTPSSPIPAASTPYLWRVRREDSSGNPGPWSAGQTFISTGVAPNLLTPQAGIWLKNAGALFEWTEVPGAATYKLNIGGTSTSSISTVATAYAPTAQKSGTYTWNVTAYDGAGNPLATSATRQYQVDATPPQVKKLAPAVLKAKSVLKATFTEKVKGISEKSVKLYRLKGDKRVLVKSKVKSLKKGKVASVDPKGSIRPGEYVLVFVSKKIKDVHGNALVPTEIELKR